MYSNKTEKFIIVVLVLTALIFLVLWRVTAYVCASEKEYSCNQVTPTSEYIPTEVSTPTFIPSDTPVQPTISPTSGPTDIPPTTAPTAGSSAVVAMPMFAPATGRAQ